MKTYIKGKGKLSHLLGTLINKDDPNFVSWDEEDSHFMSWLWSSILACFSLRQWEFDLQFNKPILRCRVLLRFMNSRQKSMMPNKVFELSVTML